MRYMSVLIIRPADFTGRGNMVNLDNIPYYFYVNIKIGL